MEKVQEWTKASQVELIYKSVIHASKRPKMNGSKMVYEFLLENWDMGKIELQEQAIALLLNYSNRVLGIYHLSTGGTTGTVIDPRLLFTAALKINASAIILAHNHPSGNLNPSDRDKYVTEKIRKAGEVLDIKVLDHLIITAEGYTSFAEEGYL
ncbi:JAB domain-containing protein [Sediminibacterium ginsengisoli]|uniref:DNA repair protein radc n=1 Tax=Sediminibacterium ginsengisoli TaxID=413434 RepID=A0A1T4P201_9BACT|nr:JAB domain-containing protein [Sediminibacterium ginsengisoli]SJZ85554.1 DNA repair protein radc [Sediminibacterium ginsengisoli]